MVPGRPSSSATDEELERQSCQLDSLNVALYRLRAYSSSSREPEKPSTLSAHFLESLGSPAGSARRRSWGAAELGWLSHATDFPIGTSQGLSPISWSRTLRLYIGVRFRGRLQLFIILPSHSFPFHRFWISFPPFAPNLRQIGPTSHRRRLTRVEHSIDVSRGLSLSRAVIRRHQHACVIN